MTKKFSNSFYSGFTLIELLVVIAIIGILSSVVLASLNTARGKGANAAVKSNLNNMRAAAELHYDNTASTYTGFCGAGTATAAMASAASAGGGTANTSSNDCNDSSTQWAAYSILKVAEPLSVTHWCVDYSGASKGITQAQATSLGSTGLQCP